MWSPSMMHTNLTPAACLAQPYHGLAEIADTAYLSSHVLPTAMSKELVTQAIELVEKDTKVAPTSSVSEELIT